ncbi:divergent polysaccharide deacetylase family protein [Mesorhizobium sp. KR1-2]|uniref:divergent polysaccharide deacetylase family protein n=1 Tax=Mesorhizobium sp. KR1-2 TaxID=3156609 RepID=UPI0032B502C5
MSPVQKDIDRPLGQNASAAPKVSDDFTVRAGTVMAAVAVVAIVASASAIAFREKPFRNPAPVVVSTPQVTEPAKTSEVARIAPPSRPKADGPSIIHVSPPDGSAGNVVVIRDASAVGQNLRVAHLPDKDLIEESETGPLPIRAVDGRRPFDVYARPWSGARGARVAIVIGGLGLSQTGTQRAIGKLPPEVTLAFAPHGNSIGRWMQEGRREGHEIVMQVPLEPFDYPNVNPGRNTLTVAASAAENLKNLRWALSRTTNYSGVMNYMGARFVADPAAMEPIMAELGKRGLLYLDDGSSARSLAPELAVKDGVPFVAGDGIIDAVGDRETILKKLDQLESIARAKGFAIGTGSAFDVTVDAVAQWVGEAQRRGIEIVPVSAVATDPEKG